MVEIYSTSKEEYIRKDGFGCTWKLEGKFQYFPMNDVRNRPWTTLLKDLKARGFQTRIIFP